MDTPTQVLIYKILNSSRCKQKDGTILDPTNMRTPVRNLVVPNVVLVVKSIVLY